MFNNSQSEKTKENKLLNPKSGSNSIRRLMTPSIKNVNLNLINSNTVQSKDKKIIASTTKFTANLQQKENLNRFQNTTGTVTYTNYNYSKSKRKFTEIQKEKEDAKKQISSIINQVDELYEKKLEHEQFTKEFLEILKIENFFNYSRLVPVSLSTKGSCLLEHSKFYILFIRYKSFTHTDSTGLPSDLKLDDFVELIDNSLMYDQDDLNVLYSFYLDYLRENYTKEQIFLKLQKKDSNYMVMNAISNLEDLNENHYKYVLSKSESFMKFELEGGKSLKPTNANSQPNSSKKRKMNSNMSIREHLEKSPAFKKLLTTDSKRIINIVEDENQPEVEEKNNDSLGSGNPKEISLIEREKINERIEQIEISNDINHINYTDPAINYNPDKNLILEVSHINENEKSNSPTNHSVENFSKNNPTPRQSFTFGIKEKNSSYKNENMPHSNQFDSEMHKDLSFNNQQIKTNSFTKNKLENSSVISPIKINRVEPFQNSTSNIKCENENESESSPVEEPKNTVEINKNMVNVDSNTNSNSTSNPNFKFLMNMNNTHNNFNFSELNITSFSSNFICQAEKSLSTDAQILYEEIILRNKLDLEIEKNSIHLKGNIKKSAKKKIFKIEKLEKFSLISEEKLEEKVIKLEENVSPLKNKKNNIQTRSKTNKSKRVSRREEDEEEKNAEDINTSDDEEEAKSKRPKSNNKRTKNLKNKKKYQSDIKVERANNISSDEKEESQPKIKESNNKKKKNFKKDESKEDVMRGRKSSIMDNTREKSKKEKKKSDSSISAKESDSEEVQTHSKSRNKRKEKNDRKSKSTTRSKRR
jgi:hypothetical protein